MINCSSRTASAARTLGIAAALSFGALLPAAAQTHVYTLNNTFADTNGGPSLVSTGGTLSPSGYGFAANQGLSLSNALDGSNYSLSMTFDLNDLSGYRKLVDFNGLADDAGLYLFDNSLNFFPVALGTFSVAANQDVTVNLARDGVTQVVTGSVNGTQQFSFVDTTGIAVFKTANSTIHFFEDDNATGQNEASGGIVRNITINSDAGGAPVPEASTTVSFGLLLALGLGSAVVAARKKKAVH